MRCHYCQADRPYLTEHHPDGTHYRVCMRCGSVLGPVTMAGALDEFAQALRAFGWAVATALRVPQAVEKLDRLWKRLQN